MCAKCGLVGRKTYTFSKNNLKKTKNDLTLGKFIMLSDPINLG